uniref:Uncharacterized protein n=1 Tax=Oryza brachyantha TaxID=4533 RepID=J3LCQ6_ORYBR
MDACCRGKLQTIAVYMNEVTGPPFSPQQLSRATLLLPSWSCSAHSTDPPNSSQLPTADQSARSMERPHGSHGGGEPANAHPQQQQPAPRPCDDTQLPASSLNPTAARLLREAIVSAPADAEKPAAEGSSDILAFARAVDRVDSTLE